MEMKTFEQAPQEIRNLFLSSAIGEFCAYYEEGIEPNMVLKAIREGDFEKYTLCEFYERSNEQEVAEMIECFAESQYALATKLFKNRLVLDCVAEGVYINLDVVTRGEIRGWDNESKSFSDEDCDEIVQYIFPQADSSDIRNAIEVWREEQTDQESNHG